MLFQYTDNAFTGKFISTVGIDFREKRVVGSFLILAISRIVVIHATKACSKNCLKKCLKNLSQQREYTLEREVSGGRFISHTCTGQHHNNVISGVYRINFKGIHEMMRFLLIDSIQNYIK